MEKKKKQKTSCKRRNGKIRKKEQKKTKRIQIEGALMCGVPIKEITRKLKVGRGTVRSVIKFRGSKKRKTRIDKNISKKITTCQAKKLKKLMKGKPGVGIKKLSKQFNFSGTTIRRWLKRKPWAVT